MTVNATLWRYSRRYRHRLILQRLGIEAREPAALAWFTGGACCGAIVGAGLILAAVMPW